MTYLPKLRRFFVAGAAYLAFVQLTIFITGVPRALRGEADFLSFYIGGKMVSEGQTDGLYDYDKTISLEREVRGGQPGANLPFIHPAYEALLFRPLASLGYRGAYFTFLIVNLCALTGAWLLLRPGPVWARVLWPGLMKMLFIVFAPVGICLLQGQDSILLLLLLALAWNFLRTERDWLAGFCLGVGLFRFQVVLPIVLLFLVWRRWKVMQGFAVAAAVVAVSSLAVAGWGSIHAYPMYLRHISAGLESAKSSLVYGVWPEAMPNLRGMMKLLLGRWVSSWVLQLVTVTASLALWVWAAVRRLPFPLCIVVALLISYHSNIHDGALLLVPLATFLNEADTVTGKELAVWSAVVFFPAACFATGTPISLYVFVLVLFVGEFAARQVSLLLLES